MEERLREAAALGDLEEVKKILKSGVNINSQNEINGWTCLHWACKRNHIQVVSYLLESGADKDMFTSKGEKPFELTSKKDIKKLLGVEDLVDEEVKPASELPFVPNYLANPPFPYSYTKETTDKEDTAISYVENTNLSSTPASNLPVLANGMENICISTSSKKDDDAFPALFFNGDLQIPPDCTHSTVQNSPFCQTPVSQTRNIFSSVPSNLQYNGVQPGPMQVFQPFFFTGAFPSNMKELVLKVRIHRPSGGDDFIEVEIDREELTYQELLRVCCCELDVRPEHVERIRKLPNTILRRDKEVARLQDFQELELVLKKETSGLFSISAPLTERPCFNKKATDLTY
ncbi:ankyrin repeat domain-containing protein 40 [Bombina bombina]|uniref:ankyrin repeat domain-containing protein 40 n=1 Tax=Bombina bombina TaxID=8345 RepID=UPI00235A7797|nr:ankyrin repeat domain-containing protein 40 [Bombina bombina]